ncbi:MAG: hypothetical protein ABFR36_05580 [Acidobacteriota bacterium]
MGENIKLSVNEKDVPMNPFVKRTFSKVIEGLVGSLDKLPDDIKKIEIIIDNEEK